MTEKQFARLIPKPAQVREDEPIPLEAVVLDTQAARALERERRIAELEHAGRTFAEQPPGMP